MKNLLIYVNPDRKFSEADGWENEIERLAKVQIDNSLELGWDRGDILLVTNFDYEYNGVKAEMVGDEMFCSFSPTASKINVIIDLLERGRIGKDLWWFHDFDAFQLAPIVEDEIGLNGCDIGITDYGVSTMNPGRSLRWSTGTIFFTESSLDIFKLWKREIEKYKANEEIALLEMLKKGRYRAVKERIKKVNITYNLATRRRVVSESYKMADKPLRVIHFHPYDKRPVEGEHDNMAVCVYGKNWMGRPLVTEQLARIFHEHGVK